MLNNKVSREIFFKKNRFGDYLCYCSTEKDEWKLITGVHREGVSWVGEAVMESRKIFLVTVTLNHEGKALCVVSDLTGSHSHPP